MKPEVRIFKELAISIGAGIAGGVVLFIACVGMLLLLHWIAS